MLEKLFNISNINYSTLNPWKYSNSLCCKAKCTEKCGYSFPFCDDCLERDHSLKIKPSIVPNAGLGLFVTKDLLEGHRFQLNYGSDPINQREYTKLVKAVEDGDEESAFRFKYLFEVKQGKYLQGHTEDGGPLRFINNAPNEYLTNCQFGLNTKTSTVFVKLTKPVYSGCELFIVYNQSVKFPYMADISQEEVNQRIAILTSMKTK